LIAIDGSVRKLVKDYFELKPLGPARIKRVSELSNDLAATRSPSFPLSPADLIRWASSESHLLFFS
jgi:hypothetical protein